MWTSTAAMVEALTGLLYCSMLVQVSSLAAGGASSALSVGDAIHPPELLQGPSLVRVRRRDHCTSCGNPNAKFCCKFFQKCCDIVCGEDLRPCWPPVARSCSGHGCATPQELKSLQVTSHPMKRSIAAASATDQQLRALPSRGASGALASGSGVADSHRAQH